MPYHQQREKEEQRQRLRQTHGQDTTQRQTEHKSRELLVQNATDQSSLGFDERPVLAVHLVVEATGVAQVVASAVPPPQGGGRGSAVDTLPTLCKHRHELVSWCCSTHVRFPQIERCDKGLALKFILRNDNLFISCVHYGGGGGVGGNFLFIVSRNDFHKNSNALW